MDSKNYPKPNQPSIIQTGKPPNQNPHAASTVGYQNHEGKARGGAHASGTTGTSGTGAKPFKK